MKKFFSMKKIIWLIVIILFVGTAAYFIFGKKNTASNIQTDTVKKVDLTQTVLATGQVVSGTDLNLSFQSNGVVKQVAVKEGDVVKSGQFLAALDMANASANLTTARGSLAQAQANYNKVLAGASSEQIAVQEKAVAAAEVTYNNALTELATIKQSTDATVSQAQTTLDDLQSPNTQSDNKRSDIVVTIAKQLILVNTDLDKENQILNDEDFEDTFGILNLMYLNSFKSEKNKVQSLLDIANASLAIVQAYKSDSNISKAMNDAINVLNQNISALNYCSFALQNSTVSSKFTQTELDTYRSDINTAWTSENTGMTSIRTDYQSLTDAVIAAQNSLTNAKLSASQQVTAAQNKINSAKAAWDQAEASLTQLKASARPADIDAAKAAIISAQGQVAAAEAVIANATLQAPADGTITSVDIKIGELATAQKEVMVLQDVKNLHVEADISEANIAQLKPGQEIDVTFDALGPDRHFKATVQTINPASTIVSGVVNFKVTASLAKVEEIKPGMTANLIILVAQKNQALAVPSRAVINQGGKQYARLIDNPQTKTYHQVEVQTGLQADGGLTEVISGLSEGQEIVVYIK